MSLVCRLERIMEPVKLVSQRHTSRDSVPASIVSWQLVHDESPIATFGEFMNIHLKSNQNERKNVTED